MIFITDIAYKGLALLPNLTVNPINYDVSWDLMFAYHAHQTRTSMDTRDISPLLVLNVFDVTKKLESLLNLIITPFKGEQVNHNKSDGG